MNDFSRHKDTVKKGSSVIAAVPHEDFPFAPLDEHVFTYLLCRFYHDISPGSTHTVPIRDVLEFARLDRPSKLHDSLRRLSTGVIEIDYETRDEDGRTEKRTMFAHYLSSDASHTDRGMLNFAFDPLLVPFLTDPKVYALISKRVLAALKNVPAQQLYQMMCLKHRLRDPVWSVRVDSLRVHMRTGNKHARYDNFRRNVIEKAIADVNAVAYEFDVVLEEAVLGGKGGQVQEVVFRAVPKSHNRIIEASAVRTVGQNRRRSGDMHTVDLLDGMTTTERGGPAEITSEGLEMARAIMPEDADLNILVADWREANRGRTFTDPDKAFVEWIEMSIERDNDPLLRNIDADVFGTLLAGGD